MAAALQTFRQHLICQDRRGGTVDLWRSDTEVVCLAVDPARQVFVELHVSTEPPERQRDGEIFNAALLAAATARGQHVNGVIEGGREDGANFYIADFVDGERLETWLERCVPLPPRLALQITSQAAQGLCELAEHPLLLAGVDLLQSGLVLNGPLPEDLCLKLCDFSLAAGEASLLEPREAEARVVQQTGGLLLRMLTGHSFNEPTVTRDLPESPDLNPELRHLLDRIFQPSLPDHPETVEQLRELLERAAHEQPPEQGEHPDRLPAAWRPRLPLAEHFAPPQAVAEALSARFTVDARPFDAAEPYRCRAAERASRRRAVVQLLPPEHLFPPDAVTPPAGEIAARLAQAPPGGHLLRLHRSQDAADTELLVEEWPGTWTLDRLVRARHTLLPEEILLILNQFDAAAREAEALGLPLHWQSAPLVAVHFSGGEDSLPPPLQRARLPLTEWPAFLLKFRAWPLTLNFTQPERFQAERLLWREPSGAAGFSRSGPPGAPEALGKPPGGRDLAVLAAWLSGGAEHLPEMLKPLLHDPQQNRAGFSSAEARRDLLQHFVQDLKLQTGTPPRPPLWTPAGKHEPKPESKKRLKMRDKMERLLKRNPRGEAPAETAKPAAPLKEIFPSADKPVPAGVASETASVGFAEALFNRKALPEAEHPLFGGSAGNSLEETAFLHRDSQRTPPSSAEGFLFAGQPEENAGRHSEPDEAFDHDSAFRENTASGKLMLFLVVVLIAAAVAALLAHFSGMAVWRG